MLRTATRRSTRNALVGLLLAAVCALASAQTKIDLGTQVKGTLAVANGGTGSAAVSQTLTDAATISWNMNNGIIATLTLTASGHTLATPTNLKRGTVVLHMLQDATGSRTVTFSSAYKFPSGVAPTLTTTALAHDVISCVSDTAALYCGFMLDVK